MSMNISKTKNGFYQEESSNTYRFGDVLKGYFLGNVYIDKPNIKLQESQCGVDLDFPEYCVLLSPCCSIGEKTIYLSPLKNIDTDFLKAPFLAEDLTRINRVMAPIKSIPPERWEKLDENKQEEILGKRESYVRTENFIYAPHMHLKNYTTKQKTVDIVIDHYMIDFRDIFKVKCNQVSSAKSAPLEAKLLELTVHSRKDLREKLSFFFRRPAVEDLQHLAF